MTYQITGRTGLCCLLGSPVAHSISPMIHNEAFRLLGLDYVYLCFDTADADLGTAVRALKELHVCGFNVTMPHKEHVVAFLDELTPAARMIGAVNTVKYENGRLIGHNTDGIGYMRAVREAGYRPEDGAMTLLGAGGAASAIAIQAALDGVPVLHIVNRRGRSWAHAEELAGRINAGTSCRADVTDLADAQAVAACVGGSALLTNATSVGMAPHDDAVPLADSSLLRPELLVSDIIYNPRQTRLLREAAGRGCRTVNGLPMLLYQGAEAFRIWTGQEMPVEEIRRPLSL